MDLQFGNHFDVFLEARDVRRISIKHCILAKFCFWIRNANLLQMPMRAKLEGAFEIH